MSKVSIIIPCYCSSSFLPGVVSRVAAVMDRQDYEIVLVNDCSPDNTFDVISSLARNDSHIIGINLAHNAGQHAAIFAGFHYATGEEIVCMDDDGQTPPDEIPALLEGIRGEHDVAYARYQTKKHSAFRNFGSYINDVMACILIGKPKDLFLSSFFAMKRYVMDELLCYENPFVYLPGLVLRTTSHLCNVDITHKERLSGNSGYTFKKLLGLWLNGFTAFSVKPLRIADFLGSIVAGMGFLYLIYTLVMYFLRPGQVAGWNSLMAVLLILGGSIMLMLGMIGEYLGRTYISINKAPQFVIRETVHMENDEYRDLREEK
ncbi:glycosyltransferase family 2 protein [Dysosmobacter sp. Sow4_B12]|uniref:glycosyltransferase family 2 protein n=1 Tax=Dysosmobacter sp. Sow4_B12 TaxID=3438777 RepID=UPI003F8E0126